MDTRMIDVLVLLKIKNTYFVFVPFVSTARRRNKLIFLQAYVMKNANDHNRPFYVYILPSFNTRKRT